MTAGRTVAGVAGAAALLLAALLLISAPAATAEATTIDLVTRHSRYDVSTITVAPGTTVTFRVRNDDPIDHELIVGDRAVHDLHEAGTEHHHDGSDHHAVSVPAGATALLTYTFDEPGQVAFGCHLPGHWDYGMQGTIRVG